MAGANPKMDIVVAEEFFAKPEVQALQAKGHRIWVYGIQHCPKPDLILHPAAHNWTDVDWDYLEAALAAARARRKAKKS